MSYQQSRTTRTYHYSGGGPGSGGARVTETRIIGGPGGTKTETKTYYGGQVPDSIGFSGFGAPVSDGFGSSTSGGFTTRFGDMNINGGTPAKFPVTTRRSQPAESRYVKGWGSRKSYDKAAPGLPPMQLEGKTYAEIKAQCLREGRLFEDPDFPAVDSSIFYSRAPPRPFVWKRPGEISQNPQLFVGGASRFDVKQGELGDCWLLAAVASLSLHRDLLYRVVPPDQSFTKDYAGIFHFQFWQYGKWTDVIVDDRLPTYYDRLVFMHSAESNEFWTPLLEKAYAKLMGSYESLKGGATSEAMEDFTGGVTETFDFRQNVPANMFHILDQAYKRCSLMGCSIEAVPGKVEAELANGLICGHAYSITAVRKVEVQTPRTKGKIPMIRIRNPWGNEAEWKGAWSDKSQEWKLISDDERRRLGLTFDDDGEFWMSFSDFTSNFEKVEICNLGPEAITEMSTNKTRWEATNLEGSWRRRVNAGGCRNYLDTFWTNPQYRVEVVDADDDSSEELGTVLVACLQKNRRRLRKEGVDLLTIGYSIYQLKDSSNGPLDMRFFKYNASVAKAPAFINLREVCGRHKLAPGQYCIIPSTFEPNQEGDFLLRVFSEKPNNSSEIDEETSMSDVTPQPQLTEDDKVQDASMRDAFRKISGEDMEIDAYELQDILNAAFMKGANREAVIAGTKFKFEGFSAETCRSMVAMMDIDRSGKLGFDEFKKIWTDLRLWKSVFKQFDKDASGNMNSYELRQAMHASGFKLSNSTFNALVQRYSHRDGEIYFDDFIHCIIRLKTMFDIFKEMNEEQGKKGKAMFGLDEFIQVTMYS